MMIENSDEKKQLFYIIVLILTLITMIIGATFAYFKLVGSQKEEGTVLYTGTLQINYLDGRYINDPGLYPMKTVDYSTYNKVYRNTFGITSTGTLDQTISIDIDITTNEFPENVLRYNLYNNEGVQLAAGSVPKSGNINVANNIFLGHGETAYYTIIIWWLSTNYEQTVEMGSVVAGRINATAKQIRY